MNGCSIPSNVCLCCRRSSCFVFGIQANTLVLEGGEVGKYGLLRMMLRWRMKVVAEDIEGRGQGDSVELIVGGESAVTSLLLDCPSDTFYGSWVCFMPGVAFRC